MSRHLLDGLRLGKEALDTLTDGVQALREGTTAVKAVAVEIKVLSTAVDRACDIKLQEMGI